MMFSRTKPLIFIAAMMFLLVACTAPIQVAPASAGDSSAAVASSTKEPATRIPLKVAVAPYLSYAPFYIAQAEGYFDEEGLDVEFIKVTRSADAVATLAQGELDVAGFQVAGGLLNAIVRESGIKIVASKELLAKQDCVYSGFVVRTGVPISKTSTITPELLKSLHFDANPNGSSGYILDKLLQRYGLSLDDLNFVDVGAAATTLEIMQQGGLDFSSMIEPFVTEARESGAGDVWLASSDVDPNSQNAIVAFGPTILKDNPEAGRRFMVAYLKAVRHFAEGMSESTLTLLEKELGLDRALLSKMCPPYIPTDGEINVQSVVDFSQWAAARKLIDAPLTAEEFWDPQFIEYANQVLKDAQ